MDISHYSTPLPDTDPVTPLYRLSGVSKIYRKGGREILAVRELDLSINDGEWLAVQGKTGHGKTTLLQAAMRESQVTSVRARSIGFIFQTFNLIPTLNAQENVETALVPLGVGSSRARGPGGAGAGRRGAR